jgi:tRNA 2-thiouridine synthesizing protein A
MTEEIDARGLRCPLPVLRLRKRLAEAAPGARVALLADDPMAAIDVPHFCAEAGHRYLGEEADGGAAVFRVRKGGGR